MLDTELSTKKKTVNVWEKEGEVIEGTPKTRTSYPNAWVNITYGCNNFCTYCIVPYVRGRERSRTPEEIINECKDLVSAGYKEITLLGQNVNSYGHDLGNTSFSALLREIDKIEGNFRLRFMTNHPKDFSEELIKTLSECKKTTKNVHLPVQAGSDRVLKLMNRRYTAEDYIKKVELLRKYIPDIAVTTDIMVGFPTETEEDFNDTYDLMKKIGFAGAFTFVYSPRSGTPAAKMDGQIDEDVKEQRKNYIMELQKNISAEKCMEKIGKTVRVIVDGKIPEDDIYCGRSAADAPDIDGIVFFKSDYEIMSGDFADVKINEASDYDLIGEAVY